MEDSTSKKWRINSECISAFRVKKSDLPKLRDALQIPDSFTCYQNSVSGGMEGLCRLLRRLAYPCRYSGMIPRFGRPTPVLSMVTNEVLDFIYNTHSHKITEWNHALLPPALLQTYADAVNAKAAALNNQLFWLHRWNCQTNCKTRREPKSCL